MSAVVEASITVLGGLNGDNDYYYLEWGSLGKTLLRRQCPNKAVKK